MKYIIVAYDRNRLIGANNELLWQGEMAADMRHFKETTTGNAVIMGRKTFESIGRPLPNRQNIVISRQALKIVGVQVAHSIEDAFEQSDANKDIYVIGGGQIYNQALPVVNKVIATEIDVDLSGDTYFPELPGKWTEEARENHVADEKNKYNYSFVTYTKQQ
ncbi:dihydrofolate reductase [Candidatus Saccharibacteria bacterium CG11_big_fil_rev_8_21_14_0_20_41_19]|nr:MAG: hypothetical protein AUK57_00985 [Candidatus Saccharibacteria bacterium CG2_30_41_52]PIQ71112.1 MAG: dihydrofolate reductase [Candidatus Saccharibacteria bacterium CG11_big_fil_rev_8_21_14_0_20_41_19]PIZ59928.1 MAG: dihydrofolate reductase [Candidatus Saccharibacteria bacterium CG_4_10_14_0_2_um_filter_41_11]PJC29711.1 MAG: dihydrofolate reductase [Candidatus Saccharibacteria bacterium CG_4_9_14_0_2_um_filter_41_9]PJE65986.1 MAG: dihydrofolate reductase [Candidatus Saccharibacteria bact